MIEIKNLSLEEKVAQMFILGFSGKEIPAHIRKFFQKGLGGIILFKHNINSLQEFKMLNKEIYKISKYPPFISIDQEGGMISQFTSEYTIFPGNMTLGATNNENYAYLANYINGLELRSLGINVNFSPVVDVNNNKNNPIIGVRSFSDNPKKVAKFGYYAFKGCNDAKIMSCCKHFPGHGDTFVDSHLGLPIIHHNKNRLNEVELKPFKYLIENDIPCIMVSHVIFECIDNLLPSSLSKEVITNLLRKELNYNNLIITDALEMDAISNIINLEDAVIKAIDAGCDLICLTHKEEVIIKVYNRLLNAVKQNEIKESRIDESLVRILKMKEKYVKERILYTNNNYEDIASSIYEDSITVVSNIDNIIPINRSDKVLVISQSLYEFHFGKVKIKQKENITAYLKVDKYYEYEDISQFNDLINNLNINCFNKVILCTYNSSQNIKFEEVINDFIEKYKNKIIHIALRNPYDLAKSSANGKIAIYETRPLQIKSLAKVLTGDINSKGTLPVNI